MANYGKVENLSQKCKVPRKAKKQFFNVNVNAQPL